MTRYQQTVFNVKLLVLGLLLHVAIVAHGSGMAPLPEQANDIYPYNTVGLVTTTSGATATGTLIEENLVLTVAGPFIDVLLEANPEEQFTWVMGDGGDNHFSVTAVHAPDGYLSTVEENGKDSANALKNDYLLIELESAIDADTAVLNVQNLQDNSFSIIVGYAPDKYSENDSRSTDLHATRSGEAVHSQFGKVVGRLYHSGDLKATSAAVGSPVFSFYDGLWSVDGLLVQNDCIDGSSQVISIDVSMIDVIESIVDSFDATSTYTASQQDINGTSDGALELEIGEGKLFSIAPDADVDYFKFQITEEANYRIESYGELDVNATLMNAFEQLITQDDDSAGSVNFRLDVLLEVGTYYLLVRPYSTDVTGDYGITLENLDQAEDNYGDSGYSDSDILEFSLYNDQTVYQIDEPGQVDTFRVFVDSPGQLLIQTHSNIDLKAEILSPKAGVTAPFTSGEISEIYDSNDDFAGNGDDALVDVFLPVGEYYLVISARTSGEYGTYRLESIVHATTVNVLNDSSDGSGSLTTAIEWEPGEEIASQFDASGDRDSFVFSVESSGNFSASLETDRVVSWYLYDSDLDRVAYSESTTDSDISAQVSAGKHFLVIVGTDEGSYTLK